MGFEQDLEIDKDVSNNIGDLFKKVKAESKEGKALKETKRILEEARPVLDSLTKTLLENIDGRPDKDIISKYQKYLKICYKKERDMEKQLAYAHKMTNQKLMDSAWNIYLNRVEKAKDLEEQLEEAVI